MSNSAVIATNLGKKFIISHEKQGGTYTTLRDVISSKTNFFLKRNRKSIQTEEFWALRDVNFEIKKGEAIGIIGRNGAGKSTLLKTLSRITEPTTGRIELNGRVASLLEVGTGFHPELSGRENIFLNGAILGMNRSEIRRKFDEIVDFSGVERFLDTPVKRYSSGMYVRLAFAVAAHLEPEILVVDEVLAVGDAEFQKKCLGKMDEVSKNQGRTVLFVSHNMSAVEKFCSRGILLRDGSVYYDGDVNKCIELYNKGVGGEGGEMAIDKIIRHGNQTVKIVDCYVENIAGEKIGRMNTGDPFFVVFKLKCNQTVEKIDLCFGIHDEKNELITCLCNSFQNIYFSAQEGEMKIIKCLVDDLRLIHTVKITALVNANNLLADWPKDSLYSIDVSEGDFFSKENYNSIVKDMKILIKGKWEV